MSPAGEAMLMRHMLSSITDFTDCCLRGVGQVMLQNNSITGLIFLVGIFINDWISGLYALLGTAVATATALFLGAPEDRIRQGLYGFNGTLTGIGLAYSLRHDAILPVYVIIATMFVTVVSAAIKDIFGTKATPLTGPFVITTWIFISPLLGHARLHGAVALGAPPSLNNVPTTTAFSLTDAGTSILNGAAQVMLQRNVLTGAMFLVAIAVNSRVSCAAAVIGSALGVGVALFLGATPIVIREGLYNFNAVLTAIAVGGVFFSLHRITVILAILAAIVSTILYGGFSNVFSSLQLPVLTAPFVITTWLCLLARSPLAELNKLAPPGSQRHEETFL